EAVLAALRKLREGLVASRRADDVAAQALLFSARLGVLVRAPEAYRPPLLQLLVRGPQPPPGPAPLDRSSSSYPSSSASSSPPPTSYPLERVERAEAAAYLVLDAACRRGDLAEAFELRHRLLRPLLAARPAAATAGQQHLRQPLQRENQ